MNLRFRTLIILLLLICETFSFSYLRDSVNMHILTWLFLISGLGLGIFILLPLKSETTISTRSHPLIKWFILISIIGFCILIIFKSIDIIHSTRMGQFADMMIFIQTQCQLLLQHKWPYTPMPILWGQASPYLPMYWMPFIPLEYFHIDLRYLLMIFYVLSIFVLGFLLFDIRKLKWTYLLTILTGLFFLINWSMVRDWLYISCTQESVAVFYYVLLGYGLVKKKAILFGISVACCLMSRYFIISWVPFFFIYLFFFDNKRWAISAFISCSTMMMGLFIIPFFIKDPSFFLHIPQQYSVVMADHWPKMYPSFMTHLGFIKYYSLSQAQLAHQVTVAAGLLTPIFIFAVVFILKLKKVAFNAISIGLGTLKILMCVFYFFIEVPENYLLYVPTFFSYIIVIYHFNENMSLLKVKGEISFS